MQSQTQETSPDFPAPPVRLVAIDLDGTLLNDSKKMSDQTAEALCCLPGNGVKVVIAESFERIHRSNLVNMGVLPLEFRAGENAASLKITGRERFDILGMGEPLHPRGAVTVRVTCPDGTIQDITATARIDTPEELVAFRHGGILPYVVRQLVKAS